MYTFPLRAVGYVCCLSLGFVTVAGCGSSGSPETIFASWSNAVKGGNFRGAWECLTPQTRGTVLQIMVLDADLLSKANPTAKSSLDQVFQQHGLNPQEPNFAQQRLAVSDPAELAADLDNVFRQYQMELGKLPASRYAKLNAIWTASAQASIGASQTAGQRATATVQGAIPNTPENTTLQAVFEKVNSRWLFSELEAAPAAAAMAGAALGMPGAPGSAMPGMAGAMPGMPAGPPAAAPGTTVAMAGDPAGMMPAAPPGGILPATPGGAVPAVPGGINPQTMTPPAAGIPANPGAMPANPGGAPAAGAGPPAAMPANPALPANPANPGAGAPAMANPGGIAAAAGGADAAGNGAATQKRESQYKQGTLEYAVTEFAAKMAEGNYTGMDYVISSRGKGLLAEIRDGEISDEKRDELKATFEGAAPQENTYKNKGGFAEIYLKGKSGHMIQLAVGKEDGVYKIREMKIHEPGASKKR